MQVSPRIRPRVPSGAVRMLQRRLRRAAPAMGVPPDAVESIGVRIVDDREMAELHLTHMGEKGTTDVLSFPARDDADPDGIPEAPLGDLVLCWDQITRQAHRPGWTGVVDEATVLLLHGLAHLVGHDHGNRAEARRMLRLERKGLRAVRVADVPRPYGGPG